MQIYLARNKVQAGPYTLDELNAMLATGEVRLDDLAWHTPMQNWQRLGDLTGEKLFYQPQSHSTPPENLKNHSFGDNVELRKPDSERVSVAELYGRKPLDDANLQNSTQHPKAHQQTPQKAFGKSEQIVYASMATRFLAVLINIVLFILAMLPFLQALMAINPDPKKLGSSDMDVLMAYSQELAMQIPSDVAGMTTLFLLAYLGIQALLIVVRGQSFGKLVTGIRVLDAKTHQLPSFTKRVLIRVMLLWLIYWLVSLIPLPVNIALLMLAVNYFMASKNPQKQGWHDKLAGTVVVKASSIKKK